MPAYTVLTEDFDNSADLTLVESDDPGGPYELALRRLQASTQHRCVTIFLGGAKVLHLDRRDVDPAP